MTYDVRRATCNVRHTIEFSWTLERWPADSTQKIHESVPVSSPERGTPAQASGQRRTGGGSLGWAPALLIVVLLWTLKTTLFILPLVAGPPARTAQHRPWVPSSKGSPGWSQESQSPQNHFTYVDGHACPLWLPSETLGNPQQSLLAKILF